MQQCGIRERQYKKQQIRIEEAQQAYDDLNLQMNLLSRDREQVETQMENSRREHLVVQAQKNDLKEQLKAQVHVNDICKSEIEKLQSEVKSLESQVSRQTEINTKQFEQSQELSQTVRQLQD